MPPAAASSTQAIEPETRALMVRAEMWKYYPRIIYDLSFRQYALAVLWSLTVSESETTQREYRGEVGRQFFPTAPNSVVVTLSLRTFFDALLRTLKLPEGSEVVWSGISIPQMVQIAEFHKLQGRAFDIDLPTFEPDLKAAERCFTSKTKLLILAPVFGRPLRHLKELVAMAKARGVLVLLDGAQCIGLRKELLEVEADITSFSFGSIKYATAIGGSVNVVRNPELTKQIAKTEAALSTRSFGKHLGVVLKNGFIMLVDDPVSFGILRVILEAVGGHIGELTNAMSRGFPGDELIRQIRHRPRSSAIRLLRYRLQQLDDSAAVWRLRSISGWDFLSQLPNYVQVASGGDPDEPLRSTFWLMPIAVPNPAVVADILQAQGFDAALGTSQMRSVGDAVTTPQCFQFLAHVVYIPVYPEMNEESRERFIRTMHKIPRRYVESPSRRFHEYVASRPEKHAYRSAAVTKLLANRPKFQDDMSALLAVAASPVVAYGVSKL